MTPKRGHIVAVNELATNSFHQHVRLLMEISPHTFFSKKYFDPVEEYVFQWRHLDLKNPKFRTK
jgi:hypothetical protein